MPSLARDNPVSTHLSNLPLTLISPIPSIFLRLLLSAAPRPTMFVFRSHAVRRMAAPNRTGRGTKYIAHLLHPRYFASCGFTLYFHLPNIHEIMAAVLSCVEGQLVRYHS
jgi:hypothetical protein